MVESLRAVLPRVPDTRGQAGGFYLLDDAQL
jgi:hypothetical protein